jgi:hypothetical protein
VYLENVVFDAVDPQTAGRSWEARLGTEPLTDEPAGYETRLAIPDGPVLDLCFQNVPEENTSVGRLLLDVADGMLVAIRIDAADPERDRDFWAWLSGWMPVEGSELPALQHPSGRGPLLEFRPEDQPKAGKNPIHLDLRLEAGDDADAIRQGIAARGGREMFHPEWGELPWRTYEDPSGNEFCILRAPA